jgi:hypothetical protein
VTDQDSILKLVGYQLQLIEQLKVSISMAAGDIPSLYFVLRLKMTTEDLAMLLSERE